MITNIGKYLECANDAALKERLKWSPYYYNIEKYVVDALRRKETIIMGGQNGMDMLLEKPFSRDNIVYDFYTDDPFLHAANLADFLAAIPNAPVSWEYIYVDTKERDREYEIYIDFTPVVRVFGLATAEVVVSVPRRGFFVEDKLTVLGPELQLLNIYKDLYNPAKSSSWESCMDLENELYDMMAASIKGGRSDRPTEQIPKSEILNHILDQFESFKFDGFLVIGQQAIKMIKKGMTSSDKSPIHRLQFITERSAEDVETLFTRLINEFVTKYSSKKKQQKLIPSLIEQSLHIPTDRRIRRYVIKVNDSPLIDIYTAAQYELIPIHSENALCAGPWTIMRFRFVDMYVIKALAIRGKAEESFSEMMIDTIMKTITDLREYIDNATSQSQLFPEPKQSAYIGVYDDDSIAKKKAIIGMRRTKYYPRGTGRPP